MLHVFRLLLLLALASLFVSSNTHQSTQFWGFYGHQRCNQYAIFTLPPEMIVFYKKNMAYLVAHAVDPDKRRYAIPDEAPRHFIDLDYYGDSATYRLAMPWSKAVELYSEDTLQKHGIVPWHIQQMKYRLTKAFEQKDLAKILKLSAEIGHYIADANVPLHTTSNYNGQKTNQVGIHGFWESRLPELFAQDYQFFVGKATYIDQPSAYIWQHIRQANQCLDSVFLFERKAQQTLAAHQRYTIENRNGQNVKTYSKALASLYHRLLHHQVERQMQSTVKMIGDFWFTCWVDAGQPDLWALQQMPVPDSLIHADEQAQKQWVQKLFVAREE